MINYEYIDTKKDIKPEGEGWEYWGQRKTPKEHVFVWKRDKDKYGEELTQ